MASASCARAQQVSLNYERLSSMEEPVAVALGDVTVVLAGLLDAPLRLDGEDDGSLDAALVGNAQVSALTQLKNRWRVSASYFGQYASDETLSAPSHRRYAASSAGRSKGTTAGSRAKKRSLRPLAPNTTWRAGYRPTWDSTTPEPRWTLPASASSIPERRAPLCRSDTASRSWTRQVGGIDEYARCRGCTMRGNGASKRVPEA